MKTHFLSCLLNPHSTTMWVPSKVPYSNCSHWSSQCFSNCQLKAKFCFFSRYTLSPGDPIHTHGFKYTSHPLMLHKADYIVSTSLLSLTRHLLFQTRPIITISPPRPNSTTGVSTIKTLKSNPAPSLPSQPLSPFLCLISIHLGCHG